MSTLPPVPPGFKAVKERNATILLPLSNTTFLNPIQEYNRDLSVAVIKRYMEDTTAAAKKRYETVAGRKAAKRARKAEKDGECGLCTRRIDCQLLMERRSCSCR
jgi:tRNA (guanine26-N2/guanine27-N2)-dimethyltransferase